MELVQFRNSSPALLAVTVSGCDTRCGPPHTRYAVATGQGLETLQGILARAVSVVPKLYHHWPDIPGLWLSRDQPSRRASPARD